MLPLEARGALVVPNGERKIFLYFIQSRSLAFALTITGPNKMNLLKSDGTGANEKATTLDYINSLDDFLNCRTT